MNSKLLQIVISFDHTGSMTAVLQTVKRNITDLLNNTFSKYKNIQISIMVHGNLCDKPQDRFEFFPFTNNIQALV